MDSGFVQHVLSTMPPALRIKLYTLCLRKNTEERMMINQKWVLSLLLVLILIVFFLAAAALGT
ncbi:MAG: hypothetical protein ACE5DN_01470, partial [Flavobacteriales bacterium]